MNIEDGIASVHSMTQTIACACPQDLLDGALEHMWSFQGQTEVSLRVDTHLGEILTTVMGEF